MPKTIKETKLRGENLYCKGNRVTTKEYNDRWEHTFRGKPLPKKE